jgi:SAM-dependent methyltransferase
MTGEAPGTGETPEAMVDEFDVLSAWTADAVEEAGPGHALPAACRGSGTPSALDWLGRRMGLHEAPGAALFDCGAGIGGPAEYARQQFGVTPVLAEPMIGACRAARRLFGLPVVAASGTELPFGTGRFRFAWSLGVLCTVPDQPRLLGELHRVLQPDGVAGLLVFVRTTDWIGEQPEGNHFPSDPELEGMLDDAAFDVTDHIDLNSFDPAPEPWREALEQIDAIIERDHAGDPHFENALRQQQLIVARVSEGKVAGRLFVVRPRR